MCGSSFCTSVWWKENIALLKWEFYVCFPKINMPIFIGLSCESCFRSLNILKYVLLILPLYFRNRRCHNFKTPCYSKFNICHLLFRFHFIIVWVLNIHFWPSEDYAVPLHTVRNNNGVSWPLCTSQEASLNPGRAVQCHDKRSSTT